MLSSPPGLDTVRRFVPQRLRDFGRRQSPRRYAILGLLLAAAWGFAELAEEVLEGGTHDVDRRVLLALREPGNPGDPLGPTWLEELARDFTALGGVGVVTLVTLAALGYLLLRRSFRSTLFVALAVGGGQLLSFTLKHVFARPRPDLVPHETEVYTASFPSGHSMMSAVTYLSLSALLARMQPNTTMKTYLFALAVGVTLLVGVTRVYLGVHYPTDVLAGWTLGCGWALLCTLLTPGEGSGTRAGRSEDEEARPVSPSRSG